MDRSPARIACLLMAACLAMTGCKPSPPPFAQLSGLMVDGDLDEISGLAASHRHPDVLWLIDDGGNPARLFAISTRGRRLATFAIGGVVKTDWEDLAAFDLDGKHYLLIADTGDNGGLRRSLQLHVFEEPASLDDDSRKQAVLKPAWSIAFRWPDGARDCEAVAVDAARGQILLISKKRQPPELFALPLRPHGGLQIARKLGTLAGVPTASAEERRTNPERARIRNQVTAADMSPDRRTLAVLTYQDVLLYSRRGDETWARALGRAPQIHDLPWLPQPEALGWSEDGRGLFATGELTPAPLLFLNPPSADP